MRILLIEDHPIVRAGCRRLLQEGGMEIEEAATIADGLRKADEFSPDIFVLDLKLPDGTGLDLLGRLSAGRPGRKIIVFSMYEDPAFAARALEAGAGGYLTKNDDPNLLLQAIETVGAGGTFLTSAMAEKLARMKASVTGDPLRNLSPRERDVLDLLGQGKTLAEIADRLDVSYRTSARLATQIRSKLNLVSMAALIKWAVDHQSSGLPATSTAPGA